jgi:hypothetical protein
MDKHKKKMNKIANFYKDYDHLLAKVEVKTLGSIRHKNIVKLYCYLSN